MTWEFAPEICRSSTDAKTLWTRCSLWVTHPDLDFGTRKNRKAWRFSAELHAKLLHLLIFIYYILLLEQVYSKTFKYSIHVVRYGSAMSCAFHNPKVGGRPSGNFMQFLQTKVCPHFLSCSVDKLSPSPQKPLFIRDFPHHWDHTVDGPAKSCTINFGWLKAKQNWFINPINYRYIIYKP